MNEMIAVAHCATIFHLPNHLAEKSLVTKLVSDINGVKDVDNKMTVE